MVDVDIKEFVFDDYKIIRYVPRIEWQENCYLIVQGMDCVLIDPGYDCENIVDYIQSKKYVVRDILVTHAHHDHIACAEYLCTIFNISCVVHPADKRVLMHAPMYSMRFAKRKIKRVSKVCWLDDDVKNQLKELFDINIIETPGHTSGGICINYKNVLFSGDTIVKGYLGRTDLPGASREILNNSVDKLFGFVNSSNIEIILPGHGDLWNASEAWEWWNSTNIEHKEKKTF